MSIVVMGMEMPKFCINCYETTNCLGTGRCFEDGTVWCGLAKGYIGFKDTSEKCPLVELPEKHGRLIDADDMERFMSDTVQGDIRQYPYSDTLWDMAFKWIDSRPTIVEAEGE